MWKTLLFFAGLTASLALAAAGSDSGFATSVTGDVAVTIEGGGSLKCISMGESGPGYLQMRNGHRTEKISFQLPLDAETGEHEVVSWTQLAAAKQVGNGYSIEISMPLKRFHKSMKATGTLELTAVGKRPGERMTGTFAVTSDSMGMSIRLEGTFDFLVPDDAREDC